MEHNRDIKERLILAALELFAEQGIHGVSMRNINVLAGTKNSGAAHYHFGNKLGLLEALLVFLNQSISELREGRIEEVKTKAEQGQLTARNVLDAFYLPYLRLFREKDYGRHAIKFYARLAVEDDPQIQNLINKHYSKAFYMLDELMASTLPHVNRERLRRHILISWVSVAHGLADLEYMHNTFYGDLATDSLETLLNDLIGFIAAGMMAEEASALEQEKTAATSA